MVAAADAGIDALKAVEANDIEALVLGVGCDRDGGGVALADDLDGLALLRPISARACWLMRAMPRPASSGLAFAT